MPITINGAGTVTGISAGGLPDASIVTADIVDANITTAKVADANITAAKLNGAQTGSAPIYGCRAWVNFDGTRNEADTGASTNGANVKIRASGNVTSVLKNATGDYTVTFTTAMPDANYTVTGHGTRTATGPTLGTLFPFLIAGAAVTRSAPTTTSFRIASQNFGGTAMDDDYITVAIFR